MVELRDACQVLPGNGAPRTLVELRDFILNSVNGRLVSLSTGSLSAGPVRRWGGFVTFPRGVAEDPVYDKETKNVEFSVDACMRSTPEAPVVVKKQIKLSMSFFQPENDETFTYTPFINFFVSPDPVSGFMRYITVFKSRFNDINIEIGSASDENWNDGLYKDYYFPQINPARVGVNDVDIVFDIVEIDGKEDFNVTMVYNGAQEPLEVYEGWWSSSTSNQVRPDVSLAAGFSIVDMMLHTGANITPEIEYDWRGYLKIYIRSMTVDVK